MKQVIELKEFWNKIKCSEVTLKDIDELEELLGKVFLRVSELEESRNKWKERALRK